MTFKNDFLIVILLILIPFFYILGEYRTCNYVRGEYNWDYGTCRVKRN